MEGNESKNIKELIIKKANNIMEEKSIKIGERNMQEIGRQLLIQILDQQWKNHLLDLDHLRQGIGLRAYAQRDPLNEYKREAFTMFENMLFSVRENVTSFLLRIDFEIRPQEEKKRSIKRNTMKRFRKKRNKLKTN